MEPYLLTQEDIDKLVALNKDMNGVPVGAEATSTEIEALGIQPAAPAVTPVTAPAVTPVTAPAVTPVTAPAVTPVTATDQSPVSAPANDNMALLQQMLDAQKPAQPFSYESMSKDQRRMLAFAGLSDAGRALQGMQGGKVEALLGRFNEQADMQRKATAATQRNQLLGGGLASREAILGAAAQGLIEGPTARLMIEELERKEGKASDLSSKKSTLYLIEALMNDPDLGQVLGLEGSARSLLDAVLPGAQEKYNELKSRVEQLRGGIFTEAFRSLRGGGQITEKEGEKASAALARLDTVQGVEAFKQALREYQFYIRQGIARLEGQAIPPNTFFEGTGASSTDPLSDEDLDNLYPPSTPTN
jgi:hypothetical protein